MKIYKYWTEKRSMERDIGEFYAKQHRVKRYFLRNWRFYPVVITMLLAALIMATWALFQVLFNWEF